MQQQLICDVFQSGLNSKNSTYISLAHLLTTSLLNPMDVAAILHDCTIPIPLHTHAPNTCKVVAFCMGKIVFLSVQDCRVCMPSSIRFRWSCTKCRRVSGVAGEDAASEDVAGEDAAGGDAAGGNSEGGDIEMCLPLGAFNFPKSLILLLAVLLLALLEVGDTLEMSDKSSRSPLSRFFSQLLLK